MATEEVKIRVGVDGAEQTASDLGQVGNAFSELVEWGGQAAVATNNVQTNFASLSQRGQAVVQRIQGVSGAVQQLVSAMGSDDHSAGLIASVAGATAQFSAMGAMFGPAGALIGGIAGFASGLMSLAEAHREAAPDISATTAIIREEADAARDATVAMEDFLAGVTTAARTRELTTLGDAISSLTEDMYRLRGSGDASDRLEAETIAERIRTLTRQEEALRESLGEETRTTGRPRTAGGARRNPDMEAWEATMRSMREDAAYEAQLWRETMAEINSDTENSLAERTRLREEAAERDAEILEREMDRQREVNEALAEAEREHQERMAEGRLAIKENEAADDERRLAQREQTLGEFADLASGTFEAFGGAIKSIVGGEKTAEEAFKGLAAAFLEMISQYATLKAATEFADAAASFARYDYAGGAAHIGAGLAFTAVAVATGVGAAAINSAPQAPARPEASSGGGQMARGGDVNIIWNSPVVTAQTEAELGRNLRGLLGAAEAA